MQVEIIDNTESNPGHILMTDLFSGFTPTAALPNMEPNTVIDTFFFRWVIGPNGDGYGTPTKYVFTSTGRKLDNKEGRKLIEDRNLSWKYPKVGKGNYSFPRLSAHHSILQYFEGKIARNTGGHSTS